MRAAHLHVPQNAAVKILPIGRKPCLSQQRQGDIGNFVGALVFHQAPANRDHLMRARAVNAVIQAGLAVGKGAQHFVAVGAGLGHAQDGQGVWKQRAEGRVLFAQNIAVHARQLAAAAAALFRQRAFHLACPPRLLLNFVNQPQHGHGAVGGGRVAQGGAQRIAVAHKLQDGLV